MCKALFDQRFTREGLELPESVGTPGKGEMKAAEAEDVHMKDEIDEQEKDKATEKERAVDQEKVLAILGANLVAMEAADAGKILCAMNESRIGVEVLAIGNDDYYVEDMRHNGALKNCIRDANAVANAFEQLGARSTVVENVKDRSDVRYYVKRWAESRLRNDGVRTAFLFWAGHALVHGGSGSTHLVPSFKDRRRWRVDQLEPLEHTVSVREVITLIRSVSKCGLIVCLDSCRTPGLHAKHSPWSVCSAQVNGSDIGSDTSCRKIIGDHDDSLKFDDSSVSSNNREELDVWFSTNFGEAASDGVKDHSPFTESLLEFLKRDDLKSMKWNECFDEVVKGTKARTRQYQKAQVPVKLGSGLQAFGSILPVADVSMHAVCMYCTCMYVWLGQM